MKKFLVLYHGGDSEGMDDVTPEQMQAVMQPWMVWAEKCGEGLVDMGSPLGGGMNVSPDGSTPSTKDVTGYSVLQAETSEAAMAMLEGHPHYSSPGECSIEMHEMMPLPGPDDM